MKANESPEKLYISSKQRPDKEIFYGTCTKVEDDDIEYIRTDAFIEKAIEWFRRIDYDDTIPPYETTEEFIEGFKKAMKGE